jgi:hypothetical protein
MSSKWVTENVGQPVNSRLSYSVFMSCYRAIYLSYGDFMSYSAGETLNIWKTYRVSWFPELKKCYYRMDCWATKFVSVWVNYYGVRKCVPSRLLGRGDKEAALCALQPAGHSGWTQPTAGALNHNKRATSDIPPSLIGDTTANLWRNDVGTLFPDSDTTFHRKWVAGKSGPSIEGTVI